MCTPRLIVTVMRLIVQSYMCWLTPYRIKTSKKNPMQILVGGKWWDVVAYCNVSSGIRCFFEDKTTVVIAHEEVDERIKVKSDNNRSWQLLKNVAKFFARSPANSSPQTIVTCSPPNATIEVILLCIHLSPLYL